MVYLVYQQNAVDMKSLENILKQNLKGQFQQKWNCEILNLQKVFNVVGFFYR